MIQNLIQFGLTKNEAKIYVGLLGIGSTTAGELIKRTNLHRNIVYDNLEKLIQKGLVSYIIVKNRKQFELTEPKEMREYIEKQKKELEKRERVLNDMIPLMEAKRKEFSTPSDAAVYKGKKGLKKVFETCLDSSHELLIFATGWGMKETMGSYYHEWHNKLREYKVKGRAIVSSKMKQKEKFPYTMRYLPDKFILPSTIMVYSMKVITIIWQEEPIVIVIESEKASELYRTYFELLWKNAKP